MYFFRNDYSEGAHPAIFDALAATNLESTVGYGRDPYCAEAIEAVRRRFACPEADVHFMLGGTITNLTLIAAALRPWEAVIAAETAHIAVHESASVEATGHKVCVVPTPEGKLTPEDVRGVVAAHHGGDDGHMVVPKMVYVSDATELGTIYTRAELEALSATCRELGLYLYLDGARMGFSLRISRASATHFTSAARRTACCSVRFWCWSTRTSTPTSAMPSSSAAACSPRGGCSACSFWRS